MSRRISHIEYRYSGGDAGSYFWEDLPATERELLERWLALLGLPEDDHPEEVAIVFKEGGDGS
jgi:hypothetical protein